MTRDHSWGLRPSVGAPLSDLQPDPMDAHPPRVLAVWNPLHFTRPDGTVYAFHQYTLLYEGEGWRHEKVQGSFEYTDGRREGVRQIEPRLRFDARNRRLDGQAVQVGREGGAQGAEEVGVHRSSWSGGAELKRAGRFSLKAARPSRCSADGA